MNSLVQCEKCGRWFIVENGVFQGKDPDVAELLAAAAGYNPWLEYQMTPPSSEFAKRFATAYRRVKAKYE